MGEVEYAPGEPKGTPWHPHRGFETVTYMIDGIFEHHDSNGGGGVITNGDTQWMTAGAGILHIEKPPEHLVMSGGLFHGFQLWVNLPGRRSGCRPATRTCAQTRSASWPRPTAARCLRIIAGDVAGFTGPGSTYTPMTQVHATISPGAELENRLASRLQRAPLRAQRRRQRGRGAAPYRHGPVGRLRAR